MAGTLSAGAALGQARAAARPAASTSNLVAVVLGNALEFYDFTIYTYFAVMIGREFFPAFSPASQLLFSVGVFGVGFVARPIGAVVIGAYADWAGRKAALSLTILLMVLGTAILSVTPSYATIGVAAPCLVVLARLIQGLSVGGEVGPATTYLLEMAADGRRGFYTSWQLATQGAAAVLGGLVGYGLSLALSDAALQAWGWRVAFLLGLLIAPVGLYIRTRLPETLHRESALDGTKAILSELTSRHLGALALGTCVMIGPTVTSYVVGKYMTTYAMTILRLPTDIAMLAGLAGGVAAMGGAIAAGWIYDRKPALGLMVLPQLLLALAVYPAFLLIAADGGAVVLLLMVALLTVFRVLGGPLQLIYLPQAFPEEVRSTSLSICYGFSAAVFGGSAQLVVTWLLVLSDDPMAPAWFLTAANLVSAAAIALLGARRYRAIAR